MSIESGPQFLKEKYDLHKSTEVDSAVRRTEKRTGEKLSQNPTERIQNYLDRFGEILERKDPAKKERGLEALKKILYDKFIINPQEIPESYFENQQRIARELGHGDIEIDSELRKQAEEVIITDQKSSLDNWVNYLSSSDAPYPNWLKYFAMRSILSMGEFDKEKKQFTKRSKGTTKPFPDLNREALSYVLDAIDKKRAKKEINLLALGEDDSKQFQKILQGENFAKLYAWAIEKITPESQEALASTKGEWIKYNKGSDHMPLVESLQGHGTGWCTAGELTAKTQLSGGDFYVYYSYDQKNKPTIPRVAIRMQGNSIGEVRGIAPEQNLDPYINDIVKKKLAEFSDGASYEKKVNDMKQLTDIEKKNKVGQELSKDDLVFLYEINTTIEGFGYQRDPRIKEICDQRKPKEDMLVIFECSNDQIAEGADEINENTKVYLGEWNIEIFQKIRQYPNIEHLYESFPDKKIFMQTLETNPVINSPESAEKALAEKNIYLSDWGKDILYKTEFSKEGRIYGLVRFTVSQLGFPKGATTDEIYARANELGLELCPAEVGPQLRLQDSTKDWTLIAMKQIIGRDGGPGVFDLYWGGGRLTLDGSSARPTYEWDPEGRVCFSFPQVKNLDT